MIKKGVISWLLLISIIVTLFISIFPNEIHASGIFDDIDTNKTPEENFNSMLNQSDADKERAIKNVADKMKKFIMIMKDMILEGIKAFMYFAKFVFNRQFFIGLINLMKAAINAIMQVIRDILAIA